MLHANPSVGLPVGAWLIASSWSLSFWGSRWSLRKQEEARRTSGVRAPDFGIRGVGEAEACSATERTVASWLAASLILVRRGTRSLMARKATMTYRPFLTAVTANSVLNLDTHTQA